MINLGSISNNILTFIGASGLQVYELVNNVTEVISSESYVSTTTLQSIAAELYRITVVTSCQQITNEEYINFISAASITIQTTIVYLIKEINFVQSQFVLFIGEEFHLSTLNVFVINESTGEIVESTGSLVSVEETQVKFLNVRTVYLIFHYSRTFSLPKLLLQT